MNKTILAIDPSGNFTDGKGKTGIAICYGDLNTVRTHTVAAKDYMSRKDYWNGVLDWIRKLARQQESSGRKLHVVVEKFVTRNNGFTTGKMQETPMLIGCITQLCDELEVPIAFQTPSQAKKRYPDEILLTKLDQMSHVGSRWYLGTFQTNDHERDALRHMLYYINYGGAEDVQ